MIPFCSVFIYCKSGMNILQQTIHRCRQDIIWGVHINRITVWLRDINVISNRYNRKKGNSFIALNKSERKKVSWHRNWFLYACEYKWMNEMLVYLCMKFSIFKKKFTYKIAVWKREFNVEFLLGSVVISY